ncbi:unnamed protein product [Ixodes hexagonus]
MRPLHYAAWQGKPDPVELLLEYNSSVNEAANSGDTPLHLAARHGHVQVVERLLRHHANPLLRNKEYRTPLDLACEFGRHKAVELLLSTPRCRQLLGESRQDQLDNERSTCLHLAARNGHTDIIRCLLAAGVDINRSTLRGTALHEAAMHGKLEVVRLLIQSGVDVNKLNSSEQTALDLVRCVPDGDTISLTAFSEMLKAVPARAVRDHYDHCDPECLSLREGDLVTVRTDHDTRAPGEKVARNEFWVSHFNGNVSFAHQQTANNVCDLDCPREAAAKNGKGGVANYGGEESHAPSGPPPPLPSPPPPNPTNFVVSLLFLPVGGLQRNGTLRSSTIKKVAPPVVPDVVGAGGGGGGGTAGRRHSSASPTSTSSSLYGTLPCAQDPRASLQGSPGPNEMLLCRSANGSPSSADGGFQNETKLTRIAAIDSRANCAVSHHAPNVESQAEKSSVQRYAGCHVARDATREPCKSRSRRVAPLSALLSKNRCAAEKRHPRSRHRDAGISLIPRSCESRIHRSHTMSLRRSAGSYRFFAPITIPPLHSSGPGHASYPPAERSAFGNRRGGNVGRTETSWENDVGTPYRLFARRASKQPHARKEVRKRKKTRKTPRQLSVVAGGQRSNHLFGAVSVPNVLGGLERVVESRHSSSSLDSGRGSSSSSSADSKSVFLLPTDDSELISVFNNFRNSKSNDVAHRLSTGSHGSSGSLTLTSSVGSHMSSLTPEVVVLSPLNVAGLLVNGVSDTEVLTTWLKNLHFEEYAHLFLQAGYDMPTISRMTPEDLTAIGITKPAHRRKLKSEISNLNISDGIPDYKPDTLLTWLKLLRLEQYYGSLCQQGYHTVDRAADLTWEDLEDIGIQKLGHQKKMMLAIKKIRDLNSGSRRTGNYGDIRHSSVDMGQVLSQRTTAQGLIPVGHPYHHAAPPPPAQDVAVMPPPHANAVPPSRSDGDPSSAPQLRTFRQQSPPRGGFHRVGSGESLLQGQPQFGSSLYQHQGGLGASDLYQHDFVPMQVRSPNRGRSLESLEDGGTAYQGSHPPGQYQYQGGYQQQGYQQGPSPDWYQMVSSWRQHGYDTDSELVRQVSHHGYDYGYEPDGTATLHRPRGLVKPRPVAKVTARALLDSPDLEFEPKDVDPKLGSDWESSKRCAPAPPKRTNSIRRQQEANMAETAFATCVQSLTSRFTMATSQDEPPLPPPPPAAPEDEEPPPPPQPLPAPPPTSSSSTLTSSSSSTSSDGELSPSGTLIRRKDSGGSSVSSESIPFANENVGTIKQRPGEVPPVPPPHGGGGAASPVDKADRRTSPTDGCRSSPEEVPVRDVPQDLRPVTGRDKCPAVQQRPAIPPRPVDKLSGTTSALGRSLPPLPPPSSSSGDVIDDIEHMLASLTDQLDAMLECELSNP